MLNFIKTIVDGNMSTGYEVGDKYYNTSTLKRARGPTTPILYSIPIDTSQITSRLVRIYLVNGGAMILMTDDDDIKIVGSSHPDVMDELIESTMYLPIPDMSLYTDTSNLPKELRRMDLPEFKKSLLPTASKYTYGVDTPRSLFTRMLDQGLISSFPTYLNNEEENPTSQEFLNSYTELLKQLYNL